VEFSSLAPAGDAHGGKGSPWWPATSPPRADPPIGASWPPICPRPGLDQALKGGLSPGSCRPPPTHLGFSPLQFRRRKKEEGGVEACGEKKNGHRTSRRHRHAGTEADKDQRGAVRGSRSRTQRRGNGAGTPTPCSTTPRRPPSPSRPRLHCRPNVSAAAAHFTSSPPWSLLCVEPAALGCAVV
jgi:hypothetical protein